MEEGGDRNNGGSALPNTTDHITEAETAAAIPPWTNSFVYQYCSWAQGVSDAPLAYHLAAAYAMLAATAPTNLQETTLAGGPYYANFYAMCVGRSGQDRKSSAVRKAKAFLSVAAPARLIVDPGSSEALIEGLCEKPEHDDEDKSHGIRLWVMEEMGSFFAATQGTSYLQKMKTALTEVFDCTAIQRSFAKGKRIACEEPRLSIIGAVTPAYLARHTEFADWEGGFCSRFFTIYAHRSREIYEQTAQAGHDRWLTLWLGKATGIKYAGLCMGLDPEALQLWRTWNKGLGERNEGSTGYTMAGQIARTPLMAVKMALLLGWDYGGARAGEPWQITVPLLQIAIAGAELHYKSVQTVSRLVSAPSKDVRDRQAVLGALRRDGWMSVGEILRLAPEVGLKKRVELVLEALGSAQLVKRRSAGQEYFWALAPTPSVDPQDIGLSLDELLALSDARAPAEAIRVPQEPKGTVGQLLPFQRPDGTTPTSD